MWKRDRVILMGLILPFMLTVNARASLAQSTPPAQACRPSVIDMSGDSFPEVQGRSQNQELWALLFPRHLPFWVDEEVKIVWRMTGSGDLGLTAHHTDGTTVDPVWGPEEHGGSNWHRPGQEWGAGFVFPKVGCWRVIAR